MEISEENIGKVYGGQMDWELFGDCVLQLGGSSDPQLAELVFAIRAKNYIKVKQLALTAAIAANPIVEAALSRASQ